jgi:hypothetical protein
MNSKGCGRKWPWHNLKHYPDICQNKTMKSHRLARIPDENQTSHPLNADQKHYFLSQLALFCHAGNKSRILVHIIILLSLSSYWPKKLIFSTYMVQYKKFMCNICLETLFLVYVCKHWVELHKIFHCVLCELLCNTNQTCSFVLKTPLISPSTL